MVVTMKTKELDTTSRILLVVIVSTVAFIIVYIIARRIISPFEGQGGMAGMMRGFGGQSSYYNTLIMSISTLIALLVAFIVYNYHLGKGRNIRRQSKVGKKGAGENELNIIKRMLSADEKKLVE